MLIVHFLHLAEESTNYTIAGLTVDSATRDGTDFSKVTLSTTSQTGGTIYTLVIDSV